MAQAQISFSQEEVTNHLCRLANNNALDAGNKLNIPHMNALRWGEDGSVVAYHDVEKNGKPEEKKKNIFSRMWSAYQASKVPV